MATTKGIILRVKLDFVHPDGLRLFKRNIKRYVEDLLLQGDENLDYERNMTINYARVQKVDLE